MKNRIYLIEYFDGCDWDTDHARLSDFRAKQFPLLDQSGTVDAKLLHSWNDEEYKAKFGRDFQDFNMSAWEPVPFSMDAYTITPEKKDQLACLLQNLAGGEPSEYKRGMVAGIERIFDNLGIPYDGCDCP